METLKVVIDAGNPVPLGLVGDTQGFLSSHQVLVIGYDADNMRAGKIRL